jgi:hypothetical protein
MTLQTDIIMSTDSGLLWSHSTGRSARATMSLRGQSHTFASTLGSRVDEAEGLVIDALGGAADCGIGNDPLPHDLAHDGAADHWVTSRWFDQWRVAS